MSIFRHIFWRYLLNGLLVGIAVYLAFLNNYEDVDRPPLFVFMHQAFISALYYLLVYASLFVPTKKFLFKKQPVLFLLSTLVFLLLGSLLLAWYQVFIIAHFFSAKTIILVPVKLFENNNTVFLYQYSDILFKVFMLYILLFLAYLARRYFSEVNARDLLKKKQADLELNLLKSEINPHFLFNALNSIYALSIQKSDKAPEVVTRLSDMLRYMLYESKTRKVVLSSEVKLLTDYLEIVRIKSNETDQIQLKVSGDFSRHLISPLILLPFIENAVKHGLETLVENAFVHVEMSIAGNQFKFSCKNAYRPVSGDKKLLKNGGIGIKNVQKILEIIYFGRHLLQFQKTDNEFTVNLWMELEPI